MSLLNHRVRGFRLVDVIALGLLVLLIMSVYLAKTMAGRERAEIASVERQIAAERAQIRLLEAEPSDQRGAIENVLGNYGQCLRLLGRVPESLAAYERAAALRYAVSGANSPLTAGADNNLGSVGGLNVLPGGITFGGGQLMVTENVTSNRALTMTAEGSIYVAAGKTYEPVVYDGAGHGFMRAGEAPDANDANKKAREEAWKRWKELLAKL